MTGPEFCAAAAHVSKGALYLHIKNKDALIMALGEQIFAQDLASYRASLGDLTANAR